MTFLPTNFRGRGRTGERSEVKWTGIMHSYDDGRERASKGADRSSGLDGERGRGGRLCNGRSCNRDRASSRFDDKNELVFVSRIDEDRLICPFKLNVLAEGRIGRMEKREEAREANHKTYQLH